jgi:hypothetical protein
VIDVHRNPNSPDDEWVEYETANVTLAVMTPHTHDYEFAPLPPGTIAFRVPDVAEAKAKLESSGVQVNDIFDTGVRYGAWSAFSRSRRQLHPRPQPLQAVRADLALRPEHLRAARAREMLAR